MSRQKPEKQEKVTGRPRDAFAVSEGLEAFASRWNYPLDAVKLANKLGVSIDEKKDKYSLAEIFHKQVSAPKAKRTMGFV